MASPNPGATSAMYAVSATTTQDAITTGEFTEDPAGQNQRNLSFHCS